METDQIKKELRVIRENISKAEINAIAIKDVVNRYLPTRCNEIIDGADDAKQRIDEIVETINKAEKENAKQAQDGIICEIFDPTDRDTIKALTDEVDDLKELVAKLANKVTKNESRIGRVEGQIIKDK